MVFILCAVFIVIGLYQYNENIKKSSKLRELKELSAAVPTDYPTVSENLSQSEDIVSAEALSINSVSDETVDNPDVDDILPEYRELYAINPDMVGWLRIAGTNIDYPVVRCNDNEYYLSHDFYKKEDKNGTPFVKAIADLDTPGDNFVVYAHNMKNGTMFGSLDNYESEDYALEHPIIEFDTLFTRRHYRVISVFRSEVYSEEVDNEDKFKYYEYYHADSPDEFNYFYENIMSLSEVSTGITADYGDRFITLSTCAYHTSNGRFVVVGKEVND